MIFYAAIKNIEGFSLKTSKTEAGQYKLKFY
jgi:hypothetical protein